MISKYLSKNYDTSVHASNLDIYLSKIFPRYIYHPKDIFHLSPTPTYNIQTKEILEVEAAPLGNIRVELTIIMVNFLWNITRKLTMGGFLYCLFEPQVHVMLDGR